MVVDIAEDIIFLCLRRHGLEKENTNNTPPHMKKSGCPSVRRKGYNNIRPATFPATLSSVFQE